ncbi:MAG: hypothetical protein GX256_07255 [Fretibacterium sp.]|nr:hypothetical protein [Fretibacterium sp.]
MHRRLPTLPVLDKPFLAAPANPVSRLLSFPASLAEEIRSAFLELEPLFSNPQGVPLYTEKLIGTDREYAELLRSYLDV